MFRIQSLVFFGGSVTSCNVLQLFADLNPVYKLPMFYISCGLLGISFLVLICDFIYNIARNNYPKAVHFYAVAFSILIIVDWCLPLMMEPLSDDARWTRSCGVHYLTTYTAWTTVMTIAASVMKTRSERYEAKATMVSVFCKSH